MQTKQASYDCGIIGGGIAGLSLAILLAKKNYSVVLFEKNEYPFHKVCGEYISNESHDFFKRLGLPLDSWNLPKISRLGISSEKGFMMDTNLGLGGFGISRFKLDHELYKLALAQGVMVMQTCKVTNVDASAITTMQGVYPVKLAVGSFGKASPLFSKQTDKKKGINYIGVKYHIKTGFPADRIELHNFNKGYCGISKIEDDRYCLCYLSDAANLKDNGNSIQQMEAQVLYKNPFLKKIFTSAEFLFDAPVTVSNIKFGLRQLYDQHLIYLGDAAGCISPLTGNGMSMAAYSANALSKDIDAYFKNTLSQDVLKSRYAKAWAQQFSDRLSRGRMLQSLLSHRTLSDVTLRLLSSSAFLTKKIVASTHGKPF